MHMYTSITECFTTLLLSPVTSQPRPLEAAKLLLSLAKKALWVSTPVSRVKSPYQLLGDWINGGAGAECSAEEGRGQDE